jgi:hypothetical protein
MTEDEYQATLIANRAFGFLQVRQHTRALAEALGLPSDCMEPPREWPHRPQRLEPFDKMARDFRASVRASFGIMRPEAYASLATAAAGVA